MARKPPPKKIEKKGWFTRGPKPCGICRKTTNCKCSGKKQDNNTQMSLFAPPVPVKNKATGGTSQTCGSCGAYLYNNGSCRNVTCKHH